MIPESSGIGNFKMVSKAFTRLNGFLHFSCSVHTCRQSYAMPVNNSRFTKLVIYFDHKRVSFLCSEYWPGTSLVKSPCVDAFVFGKLPLKFGSSQFVIMCLHICWFCFV